MGLSRYPSDASILSKYLDYLATLVDVCRTGIASGEFLKNYMLPILSAVYRHKLVAKELELLMITIRNSTPAKLSNLEKRRFVTFFDSLLSKCREENKTYLMNPYILDIPKYVMGFHPKNDSERTQFTDLKW